MSVISPCHFRHEVLRLSYVVYFVTGPAAAGEDRDINIGSPVASPNRRCVTEPLLGVSRGEPAGGAVREWPRHHRQREAGKLALYKDKSGKFRFGLEAQEQL